MNRPFSQEELDQLARLDAMQDEDIDTGDIPVMSDDEYNDPARPRYRGAQNKPVILRVEGRVAHWFRSHAPKDSPVEVEINRILLDYVDEQERRAG